MSGSHDVCQVDPEELAKSKEEANRAKQRSDEVSAASQAFVGAVRKNWSTCLGGMKKILMEKGKALHAKEDIPEDVRKLVTQVVGGFGSLAKEYTSTLLRAEDELRVVTGKTDE